MLNQKKKIEAQDKLFQKTNQLLKIDIGNL